MKVVINTCFGGFGLSDEAYEKLIEWGIPARPYIKQPFNPKTKRYEKVEANDGQFIFDRDLYEDEFEMRYGRSDLFGRYWDTWLDHDRSNPLLVKVVEELGEKANGRCAALSIVEIPDGVDYEICEYDGNEHIAEKHRTWR